VPKAVGIIHVERIFNLQSGANAGKEINSESN
ncbi:TPA: pyridoxamine 5'-phosphate oxidase, partial [Streptococcus pyogenes]